MRWILYFCRCFVKRDTMSVKLALVHYKKLVPSLNSMDEISERACLQWATLDGRENISAASGSKRRITVGWLRNGLEQFFSEYS